MGVDQYVKNHCVIRVCESGLQRVLEYVDELTRCPAKPHGVRQIVEFYGEGDCDQASLFEFLKVGQVGIDRIALPFVTELGQMAGGIGTGCGAGTDPSRWLPAGHFRKKLCGETDVLLVIGGREFCVYDILGVAVTDYAVSGIGNRFHKLRLAFRQRTGSQDVRGGVCLLEFPHQAPNAVDCAISPVGISIGVENSCRNRIAHGADT